MPSPGWYPDPGGRPGHYRYWDGQAWAPTTTPDLPKGPPAPPGPRRRGRFLPWVVGAAVLGLVVALVGALALVRVLQPVAGTSTSSPPVPTETPTSAEPPSPSSPTTSPSPTRNGCPIGNPNARQEYPRDSRVHGAGLSFPLPEGWTYPAQQTSAFTWAYDVGAAELKLQPRWYATYAVGAVAVADGFEDPRSAALLAMACTTTSTLYRNVTSRIDLVSRATKVGGHPAWTLRSEIRADDPRTTFDGDTVQITVVDLDSADALAFFWGCAPIGDRAATARLDRVARSVRVG